MKLGVKVFLVAIVSILSIVVSTIIVSNSIATRYIENEELGIIQEKYTNAARTLDTEKRAIERTQTDWTHWDETYEFIGYTYQLLLAGEFRLC